MLYLRKYISEAQTDQISFDHWTTTSVNVLYCGMHDFKLIKRLYKFCIPDIQGKSWIEFLLESNIELNIKHGNRYQFHDLHTDLGILAYQINVGRMRSNTSVLQCHLIADMTIFGLNKIRELSLEAAPCAQQAVSECPLCWMARSPRMGLLPDT